VFNASVSKLMFLSAGVGILNMSLILKNKDVTCKNDK